MRKKIVLWYETVASVDVFPSLLSIHTVDGATVDLDVGMLYELFAAHLYQNGLWRDVDFASLPESRRRLYRIGEIFRGEPTVITRQMVRR